MMWGHRKAFGFYYKCDEKPLEVFTLRNDAIGSTCLEDDHGCYAKTGWS